MMIERTEEIRFLREQAARIRALADAHKTRVSEQLHALADEFEARAADLERRG
jgi:hypothetical protein